MPYADKNVGLEYAANWKRRNRAKVKAQDPELYEARAAKERERVNALNEDKQRKQRNAEWAREYRAANAEKIREIERNDPKRKAKSRLRYYADPEKALERSRDWARRNPEKYAAGKKQSHMKAKAKTIPSFQPPANSLCESCGDDVVSLYKKGLACDHCHTTGHFRGWLCINCNLALGHLKDSPDRIMKLLRYAEERC